MNTNKYTMLTRWDLIEFEQLLLSSLKQIIPFESHAIYFPQNDLPKHTEWLPEEEKLLIPLHRNDKLLGVFMARKPDPTNIHKLLPFISSITMLCLDKLELYKQGRIDLLTGLANRHVFMQRLTEEITLVQTSFSQSIHGIDEKPTPYKSSVGVLVIRFNGLAVISHEISHTFVEQFITALADIFTKEVPKEAFAARTGDYEFSIILTDALGQQYEQVAHNILTAMRQYYKVSPLTERKISAAPHAGYAIYPHDIDGTRQLSIDTHANIIMHKAGLAATTSCAHMPNKIESIMAYSNILHEGGKILQTLPFSRITTNLGKCIGAREGQRFSIWSTQYTVKGISNSPLQPLYKGELVLIEIQEAESIGEILHLGDPTWSIEVNDTLTLIPEETSLPFQEIQQAPNKKACTTDPLTGLLKHGDFLAQFSDLKEKFTLFSLVLIHTDTQQIHKNVQKQHSHLIAQLAMLHTTHFSHTENKPTLSGRFALNSLLFFHPEQKTDTLYNSYKSLCTEASKQLGIPISAGIALWPFLNFRPSDILDCCRKALEYALLLPEPRIGIFNSVALNISADKKQCRGDVFGAIEEYKLALLADENNALAWSSLGVCMASLGKYTEAQKYFQKASTHMPDDPSILYNLGVVYQILGETKGALTHFHNCLALSPKHIYAMIRIGEIAEAENDTSKAIKFFSLALTMNAQSSLPYRHLAKILLKKNDKEKAREYLHEALIRNPRDAITLTLMAKTYLDEGEDPALAESLARQSIIQRPDRKAGWLELARSLECQGRKNEAQDILTKAQEL